MPAVPTLPPDKSLAFRQLVRGKGRPRKHPKPGEPPVVALKAVKAKIPDGKAPAPRKVQVVRDEIEKHALLTAQQYAEQEARKHAHRATELIRRSVESMEVAMGVVEAELPFTDGKDVRHLLEGYRAATAEMRKALGIREDNGVQGPQTLVSIQCVGDVHVNEPDEDSAPLVELPDLS